MKTQIEDEHTLLEMARVGITSDNYEIVVFTDDGGKIPHFHMRDAVTKGHKFHTCIRFDSVRYFHRGNKQDTLNSKERKDLVKFLSGKCHNKRYKTNWEYALSMWNDNNSDTYIDENSTMPNYLELR